MASVMARSVTGPAARVSMITRLSTAGEATIAISAMGLATGSGRPRRINIQYTPK
ncbi:hypothetical protein D3C72_1041990 [compost metagenome]